MPYGYVLSKLKRMGFALKLARWTPILHWQEAIAAVSTPEGWGFVLTMFI